MNIRHFNSNEIQIYSISYSIQVGITSPLIWFFGRKGALKNLVICNVLVHSKVLESSILVYS